jgi:hypothetical protein
MTGTASLSKPQIDTIWSLSNRLGKVVTVVIHPPTTLHGPVRVQFHRALTRSVERNIDREGNVL